MQLFARTLAKSTVLPYNGGRCFYNRQASGRGALRAAGNDGGIMQDMQDMIDRLNQSGKRLSKGHRKIAQYIVEHYDKAVFMTASRLG